MKMMLATMGGGDFLSEMHLDDVNEQGLPPGFRFHPTDEELITFYLASKVFSGSFCGIEIAEVDLNRCEPWELPDIAKMGEREWYFFSLRDRKYPTGLRTNRATEAGYWKATGKDREVYSASNGALLGMKKTLVFYKGRAPRGEKTKWVMHEYRLDGNFSYRHASCKEEWVICRIVHKPGGEKKTPFYFAHHHNYLLEVTSSPHQHHSNNTLPPLLESPTKLLEAQPIQAFQEPYFLNQDSDIETLINPALNPHHQIVPNNNLPVNSNNIQPFSLSSNSSNNISSALFKSLLSHHQDCMLKEEPSFGTKQFTKPDSNMNSYFQQIDGGANNFNWLDKIQNQNLWQHNFSSNSSLSFEMGYGALGLFSNHPNTIQEMSTSSVAFSRAGI
ncbi:hypothetical protein MKW94_002949 [Papaver nudicaule]|uniref:NAC domain-containing protein n=1 Tax=Papaver nudicaule TaxID=74823 RepID=A0AA41S0P6_PAPNU|nr:hypothetical protein [Papaver nudicaule]